MKQAKIPLCSLALTILRKKARIAHKNCRALPVERYRRIRRFEEDGIIAMVLIDVIRLRARFRRGPQTSFDKLLFKAWLNSLED